MKAILTDHVFNGHKIFDVGGIEVSNDATTPNGVVRLSQSEEVSKTAKIGRAHV